MRAKPGTDLVRFRVHNKGAVKNVMELVKGHIQDPVRMGQQVKMMRMLDVPHISPYPITTETY